MCQDDTTIDDGTTMATTSSTTTASNDIISASSTTVDSRGIPGWEKVAQLAQVLVGLDGLSVSNEEVQKIKALWDDLDPYNKRATEVLLKSQPLNLRGHFCGQKRTGHTTTEQMRRYTDVLKW